MNIEKSPICAFESKKAFCNIAQKTTTVCRITSECIEANSNGDLHPSKFCETNPAWTIDQAIVLRRSHAKNHPNDKTPLKSSSIWLQRLPDTYQEIVREKYKKEAEKLSLPK